MKIKEERSPPTCCRNYFLCAGNWRKLCHARRRRPHQVEEWFHRHVECLLLADDSSSHGRTLLLVHYNNKIIRQTPPNKCKSGRSKFNWFLIKRKKEGRRRIKKKTKKHIVSFKARSEEKKNVYIHFDNSMDIIVNWSLFFSSSSFVYRPVYVHSLTA